MKLERLYLDFNATSPLSQSVIDWLKSGDLIFANPSSQHSLGKSSRKEINRARSQIFSFFSKSEKETKLFFHSGATESFETFAYSFTETARLKGAPLLMCYSRIDHPAVKALSEKYWGPDVKFLELKLNSDLTYDHAKNFELIQDKKDNHPDLIILYHHLWVHNETGLVSPLDELKKLKTISDLHIHVDCVQAPGKIGEWQNLSAGDIWSFSAHKFGALKGIGFSLVNVTVPFHPLISGGGQQQGMRSGTENPMGVKSIALALEDLIKVDITLTSKHRAELEAFIENELRGIGDVLKSARSNSNTIYFYLNELTSDIALALFDLNGLLISAGSACSSGAAKESAVLIESGHKNVARNGLRISLPFAISEKEILIFKAAFSQVFEKLRNLPKS